MTAQLVSDMTHPEYVIDAWILAEAIVPHHEADGVLWYAPAPGVSLEATDEEEGEDECTDPICDGPIEAIETDREFFPGADFDDCTIKAALAAGTIEPFRHRTGKPKWYQKTIRTAQSFEEVEGDY